MYTYRYLNISNPTDSTSLCDYFRNLWNFQYKWNFVCYDMPTFWNTPTSFASCHQPKLLHQPYGGFGRFGSPNHEDVVSGQPSCCKHHLWSSSNRKPVFCHNWLWIRWIYLKKVVFLKTPRKSKGFTSQRSLNLPNINTCLLTVLGKVLVDMEAKVINLRWFLIRRSGRDGEGMDNPWGR